MANPNKLLVITGPTAVGKTSLAIELAQKFSGEIISADSRQVYKFMDIGTGKDKTFFQWGLDLVLPNQQFNVSQYTKYAVGIIKDIWKRNKLPIIVGGSGQYIKELLDPSETLHIPPDPKLRLKLFRLSLSQLQEELQRVNLAKWQKMNPSDQNNPRRLVRAIELAFSSSKRGFNPLLEHFDSLVIGLTAPKETLYRRIDARIEERIKSGMAAEKKKLQEMGYHPDAFGYKEESVEQWQKDEHAYAKRQLTYQKKLPGVIWFDITDSTSHNKMLWLIRKFAWPVTNKKRSTPTIWPRVKK